MPVTLLLDKGLTVCEFVQSAFNECYQLLLGSSHCVVVLSLFTLLVKLHISADHLVDGELGVVYL